MAEQAATIFPAELDDPHFQKKKEQLDRGWRPYRVEFKKWFFEHYHDNKNVNREEILLWEQMIRVVQERRVEKVKIYSFISNFIVIGV